MRSKVVYNELSATDKRLASYESKINTILGLNVPYGHTPGTLGTVVSLDQKKYDCTSFMSAVTGIPHHSTEEWASSNKLREKYFSEVEANDYSDGDWLLVRYHEAGGDVEGHVQLNLSGGRYSESLFGVGPRISDGKETLNWLKNNGYVIDSVRYLRPKDAPPVPNNEWPQQ